MIELDENQVGNGAKIKVIGVGGGGGNALDTMIRSDLDGVDFIAANTDVQALSRNMATHKMQIGANLTKGLGAGANPDIGRNAALEDQSKIAEFLRGADMVFVTAGMGGGTGTGAAPVIAEIARDCGALTVGVVTKPFLFEGKRRRRQAEDGISGLKQSVDTLIVIPNQKLLSIATENMSIIECFQKADEVLLNAVRGISDLITVPGLINVDFADVRTIMREQGLALMGTGIGTGPDRAREAAEAAIHSPLLEDISINGATGILINITGGEDLGLLEVNEAATFIQEAAHEDANIIFGSVIEPGLGDVVKITVIATGFDHAPSIEEPIVQRQQRRSFSFKAPSEAELNRPAFERMKRDAMMPKAKGQNMMQPVQQSLTAENEVPAPIRYREKGMPSKTPPMPQMPKEFATMTSANPVEEEFDIPAYIRRKTD
jgi:cell division protein FtsZ